MPSDTVISASERTAPLAGLRVIEVSSFVAGPLGGLTLAQLGAEVVRVDPIGGGPDYHRWPLAENGRSLYWAGLNKGKRSVSVDLRAEAGRELVRRLLADSGPCGGILLTNAVGKPWLGYDALRDARPDLIHVQIVGHADGRPAVDYTVNAEMGFSWLTGPPEIGVPVNHVLPAWDVACGLQVAIGLLAAERRRSRTGCGESITLSLYDVALALAGNLGLLTEAQLGGERRRVGNSVYGIFAQDFALNDGSRVMVVALTTRQWRSLISACGLQSVFAGLERDLPADFDTDRDRYTYREAIAALLAPWFARHGSRDLTELFGTSGVLWSPFRSFTQLMTDELADVRANAIIDEIDEHSIGRVLAPRSALRFLDAAPVPARPSSRLGEDTDAVLSEWCEISTADIGLLRDAHIVGPQPADD